MKIFMLEITLYVQIHQAEYKGDSRTYIESNFSFEATAAQSPAEFFIYTSNPNDPKVNSVELTSPTGVKYTTQLSDLHDINVIKIDAVINEVRHAFRNNTITIAMCMQKNTLYMGYADNTQWYAELP